LYQVVDFHTGKNLDLASLRVETAEEGLRLIRKRKLFIKGVKLSVKLKFSRKEITRLESGKFPDFDIPKNTEEYEVVMHFASLIAAPKIQKNSPRIQEIRNSKTEEMLKNSNQ
jgi:hypothetical protein